MQRKACCGQSDRNDTHKQLEEYARAGPHGPELANWPTDRNQVQGTNHWFSQTCPIQSNKVHLLDRIAIDEAQNYIYIQLYAL